MSAAAPQLLSLPALALPAAARLERPLSETPSRNSGAPFLAQLSAELRAPGTPKQTLLAAARPEAAASAAVSKALPGQTLDPQQAEKIKNTAEDFESLLAYQLLKEMWKTIPEDGLLNGGLSTQFFREMWLEELSKKVSHSGNGLGIAKIIERQLTETALRSVNPADLPPAN